MLMSCVFEFSAQKRYSLEISFWIWKYFSIFDFLSLAFRVGNFSIMKKNVHTLRRWVFEAHDYAAHFSTNFFNLPPGPHFLIKIGALFLHGPKITHNLCVWSVIKYGAFQASLEENVLGDDFPFASAAILLLSSADGSLPICCTSSNWLVLKELR